ncbi:MAG: sulfate adenylyltransferase subunit CysD [Elioraea sp.]|nr:sulfate adenylyltransferase subunit CysD [Elioraea sp.]MDW8443079.1 sulfate adenylyltransferase subunit CysD [Acetobacteraceae bacterium]
MGMNHLDRLEAESIAILRETAVCFRNPVLLYSVGKDSSVVLHLARKAFHPAPLPFPVLHVDTGWKFRDMIRHRDEIAARYGLDLRVHTNEEAARAGITPFTATAAVYNQAMKTEALKQALARWAFDAAIGGARRDEEKSRAKERVFSLRTPQGRWEPRQQRPEFWHAWNTHLGPGETMRVFPLSDWTERDVWDYIWREAIPLVPLYFARERPVVRRQGTWIVVDDDRFPLAPGERPELRRVRFRSIGCYPYTGAVESDATTLADVILEMRTAKTSERQGRLIDHDVPGSMERKKQEGYF